MNIRLLAGVSAAVAASVLVGGAANASANTKNDSYNCPQEAVCVVAMDHQTVLDAFYSYGAHNLSNKIGTYYVDNHQTFGATADLCYGYGGVDCTGGHFGVLEVRAVDLTPINSIRLNP
jgi:hypothetical protein